MIVEKEEPNIPTCPKCGRKNLIFRIDGSVFCRACGYDSKKKEK
jgi:uncharacterized Zn finger protein (UPF0148 family)